MDQNEKRSTERTKLPGAHKLILMISTHTQTMKIDWPSKTLKIDVLRLARCVWAELSQNDLHSQRPITVRWIQCCESKGGCQMI